MITSLLGLIDETRTDLYDKTVTTLDNKDEFTVVTEYREFGELVVIHRSAHVTLKKPAVFAESIAGSFC